MLSRWRSTARMPHAPRAFSSIGEFEAAQGQPTVQGPTTVTKTVYGVGADQILMPPPRQVVRYGLSVEFSVFLHTAEARTRLFLCHPEAAMFDSMELTVTGIGTPNPGDRDVIAEAQLIQLIGEKAVRVSGPWHEEDGEGERDRTAISLLVEESVIEYQGGFIERPWPLFAEVKIDAFPVELPLPAYANNARVQVTVNLTTDGGGW